MGSGQVSVLPALRAHAEASITRHLLWGQLGHQGTLGLQPRELSSSQLEALEPGLCDPGEDTTSLHLTLLVPKMGVRLLLTLWSPCEDSNRDWGGKRGLGKCL